MIFIKQENWLLFSDFYKNAEVKLTYFDRKQLKTKTLAVLKCIKQKQVKKPFCKQFNYEVHVCKILIQIRAL